eukprot:gnl/TRDRNA2_/TRDRNA2_164828_c0_seq3.p1 gnl/TRDRNA2_/TRDRNA2_164828_c0~~gnl/TRDRNA2_/TRDRNA2_164828_c0_seq3.p1  ORF type:complete len:114 (-),score=4.19 gnl/TRDRNA2_/TRDRNA2_164828_c0_seq3:3-344(-)
MGGKNVVPCLYLAASQPSFQLEVLWGSERTVLVCQVQVRGHTKQHRYADEHLEVPSDFTQLRLFRDNEISEDLEYFTNDEWQSKQPKGLRPAFPSTGRAPGTGKDMHSNGNSR